MTRLTLTTILVASFGFAACTDSEEPPATDLPPSGTSSGEDGNTFDHMNDGISVWELLDRLQKEGPPSFTSQVHGCIKMKYETVGNVLRSLGVDTANATLNSAGQLYADGYNALGGPNFANRIRENGNITTSGASRLFDIFAAASDEIIAKLPTLARCGTGTLLFEPGSDNVRPEGITCLIGSPATSGHVEFANLTVRNATTVAIGKRVAVAALLAAAYICE